MLVIKRPSESFHYKTVYGLNEKDFNEKNIEMHENGFTLIQIQVVQLMHMKSHQAVWVKDD
jgi:hypothetical protein